MGLLSNQKVGCLCEISSIDLPKSKKIKLLGLGVNTGLQVSVLINRSGDMVLVLGNARISIGKSMAGLIKVSVV